MITVMRVVCCYCGLQYATKDGEGQTEDSHGICPECFKLLIKSEGKSSAIPTT